MIHNLILFTTPRKSSNSGTEFYNYDKSLDGFKNGTVVFETSSEKEALKYFKPNHLGKVIPFTNWWYNSSYNTGFQVNINIQSC